MNINIDFATDLVMQATTHEKIQYALSVFKYPASNAVKLNISDYQRKMMIEQLNVNDCNLAVNGRI